MHKTTAKSMPKPPSAPALARAALLAFLLAGPAAPCGNAASLEPLEMQEASPGDYVHFGEVALTTPDNAGDIANLGIVIGNTAVAVIDSGGSVVVGERLLAAVRALTDKPIRYLINTHEHPDHVFGNAAFALPGVSFVGHHNLPQALAARAAHYLHAFAEPLGPAAIASVRIIPPTVLVQDRLQLDLGGRNLLLTAWSPAAHTNCDLTVLDQSTGTLFAGDLVFLQQIPVVDGSVKGWLDILPRLAALPAQRVVPGHGQLIAPWPQALDDERRYLTVLANDTRRFITAGVPLEVAVPQIAENERERWALFDDYNPRNATAAFSELEWE
jgi:quinoprotein relay system zinc metallohydrolase 2